MREQSISWEYWSSSEVIRVCIKPHKISQKFGVANLKCAMRMSHIFPDLLKNKRGLFLIWFGFYLPFYVKADSCFPLLAIPTIFFFLFFFKKGTFLTRVPNISGHIKRLCNCYQLMLAGNYLSNPPLVEGRSRRL